MTVSISIFLLLMPLLEKRLLFYPSKIIDTIPGDLGLEYEDVFFKTSDGIELHGWFIPAGDAYATVLFFHGNAGNIGHRVEIAKSFVDKGMNFFIFDYRGFGKSKGSPDEKGIYLDGLAAYSYLLEAKGILAKKIVLYGKSLGAAVAIETALRSDPGALIAESGFTSLRDMAREIYSPLPLWLFIGNKYNSLAKIDQIEVPLLVIHSKDDEIVPFNHGEQLFERAGEPKEFYQIRGGHNDAFYIYSGKIIDKVDIFLRGYLK